MKTQSPDTSIEAERVLIDIARRMPAWRKLQLAEQWGATLRRAMKAEIRDRLPTASVEEREQAFLERWLGPELAAAFLRARNAQRPEC
jgi:hypothetical protein